MSHQFCTSTPEMIAPDPFCSSKLPAISRIDVSTASRRKPIGSPIAYEKNCGCAARVGARGLHGRASSGVLGVALERARRDTHFPSDGSVRRPAREVLARLRNVGQVHANGSTRVEEPSCWPTARETPTESRRGQSARAPRKNVAAAGDSGRPDEPQTPSPRPRRAVGRASFAQAALRHVAAGREGVGRPCARGSSRCSQEQGAASRGASRARARGGQQARWIGQTEPDGETTTCSTCTCQMNLLLIYSGVQYHGTSATLSQQEWT
eukprot:1486090-Prymnesium_polylepis.2